jgi:hypothetical protein
MINGLAKHEATLVNLTIAGTSYKVADAIRILQSRADAATAVETANANWRSAVKRDHEERAHAKTFVSGLRQALLVAFAGSIDSLADFGLNARKPSIVAPETRVAAAQKDKSTRAARHTMGKKQKVLANFHVQELPKEVLLEAIA